MAKEDFCFTYYDGDAARDKAHMTRLERGAYDDIISAQRKKGHLSLNDIKRVLSKDFDQCWPSLEWILIKDGEGKFFIEWVDISVLKSKANSQKNKDRINEYWRKVEAGEIIPKNKSGNTKTIPRNKNGIPPVIPLGDGNGNGNGNGNTDFGKSENLLVPSMVSEFVKLNPAYPVDEKLDYPQMFEVATKIKLYERLPKQITEPETAEKIKRRWGEMVSHIRADAHLCKYSLTQINKHFQSIVQSEKNGSKKSNSGFSKSSGIELAINSALSKQDAGGN